VHQGLENKNVFIQSNEMHVYAYTVYTIDLKANSLIINIDINDLCICFVL